MPERKPYAAGWADAAVRWGVGGGLQTEDTYAPRKSAVWRLSAGREGRGKVRLSPECHLAPQPTAGACHYVVGVAVGSSWRLRRGDLATV